MCGIQITVFFRVTSSPVIGGWQFCSEGAARCLWVAHRRARNTWAPSLLEITGILARYEIGRDLQETQILKFLDCPIHLLPIYPSTPSQECARNILSIVNSFQSELRTTTKELTPEPPIVSNYRK